MAQRLSKEFLFTLRNHIPISDLIQHTLGLPWKISENYFRFQCPKCLEFRTAVSCRTNLARCFLCKENFNCIDLVMIVQNVPFLKAVEILTPLSTSYSLRREILK